MANVIQTKKKRDKKKKKEDGTEEFVFHQSNHATPTPVDDLNIHVHKEATTGGGLCAKLVFFVLLTLLSTLIGLIITEHRGLTDLDTINTESAFARIFDGWIDTAPEDHEEAYSVEQSLEDEVDASHSQSDEEGQIEGSEEQETSKTESDEDNEEEYQQNLDEDEEEEQETETQEYSNEDDDKTSETAEAEKDETIETQEEESKGSVISEDEPEDDEESFQEEMNQRISEKSREISKEDASKDEEEEIVQLDKIELVKSNNLEEMKVKKEESENSIPDDLVVEIEKEASNMVVRFGVGAALLVVAHVVLVRKWRTEKNSSEDDKEDIKYLNTDLSRRDTIIPPPTLDEIGQDFEHIKEDYSDEEEDDDDDEDEEYEHHVPLISPIAQTKYQELRSTYSNNLYPDWEPKRVITNSDEENDEDDDEEEEYDEDEEVDEVEEENEEISENEDEELLRRLEAKYGILRQSVEQQEEEDEEEEEDDREEEEDEESDKEDGIRHWKRENLQSLGKDSDSEDESWSNKRSGANSLYDFSNITNVDDWKIREELDRAEKNLANDAAFALTMFKKILEKHPFSPRSFYGKSRSLDVLAEKKKSNKLLEEAIVAYQQILKLKDVPDALFQLAAERCINRIRFRGAYAQAVPVHKLLINRFPKNVHFQNELAVTYLTMNNFYEAKKLLYDILSKWPDNGFAMVNYGFILKQYDLNLKQAVKFLKKGIQTRDPGVIDGRFFYHLGDALIRLRRKDEAMAVHIDGVHNKVFLSKYQRSLHNVNRLLGKPWWKKEDMPNTQFFNKLENNWKVIRDEGLSLLNTENLFKMETEDLREVGDWKQFELFARGIKNVKNCKRCPKTCQLIESFPDAVGCKRGQVKFSVVQPGTHVWPHCGPTNCRLRSHLGLKVPPNVFLRVADEIRSWEEGKLLIFDDSFEHEIWHNGSSTRLILIVDFWHPQLTKEEKLTLSSV